jgi:hypothetical protein
MKGRQGFAALAMAGLLGCVVTVSSQTRERGERPPAREGRPEGRGDRRLPPPPELGKILPPHVMETLKLTADQKKKIAELEKEVKTKLDKILTTDQKKQLEEMRRRLPPRGDRHGPPREGEPRGERRPEGGRERKRPEKEPEDNAKLTTPQGGIQWFATWESGLGEARRTGKPILLVSGAPHCAGVSGIW